MFPFASTFSQCEWIPLNKSESESKFLKFLLLLTIDIKFDSLNLTHLKRHRFRSNVHEP